KLTCANYLYSLICAAQFRQTLILVFSCLFFDNTAAEIMTVPNRMMIVKQIISVTITPVLTLVLLVVVGCLRGCFRIGRLGCLVVRVGLCRLRRRLRLLPGLGRGQRLVRRRVGPATAHY